MYRMYEELSHQGDVIPNITSFDGAADPAVYL